MQPAAIQWEMLGLAQPVIRMDRMQRMSMMMAMLVLGPPHMYGCRTQVAQGVTEALTSQYLNMCQGVGFNNKDEEGSWRANPAMV
jgi:hypothetical protein